MSAALSLVAPDPAVDYDDLLTRLCRDFEEAEWQSVDGRAQSERCRDYVCGKQWTEEEAAELKRRGQPLVWNNIIAEKIEVLRGIERRGRSDPKAFPRSPVEDMRADAATEALRYIADQNRFDVIRSAVYDNMLVEGVGGAEVIVEVVQSNAGLMETTALTPRQPDYDVTINHIPWDRLFWDPHSRHPGFTDARYLGCVIWMDRDEALERYPGCEHVLESTFSSYSFDTFNDKPLMMWSDSKRRRVRVVQEWFKRGEDWHTATFTKGGFLEEPMVSPYLDRHMHGHCPIIMRSAHVDRDNNRFGVVKDMIPRQDMVNKTESKLTHSLSVNQIVFEEGAVADEDKARIEAAKPDGVIKLNPGGIEKFRVQKDTAEIQGHFQRLQYAIQQMQLAGPNAAMSGKDPRELSGRAILAQQAGGMLQNEALADELRQWSHKIWEAAWMRIRQFWTAERWIRVTDNDRNVRFVGLNRRVTVGDLLADLDKSIPVQQQIAELPPQDQQAVMFGMQLPPGDPRLGLLVRVENDVQDMDVDITVEEGPDTPTVRHETWQTFVALPPQVLVNFPPEVFVSMNPGLRGEEKTKLLELLEKKEKAQAEQAAQAQALVMAKQQAEVQNQQASAQDKQASAMVKMHSVAMDHAHAAHTPIMPGVGPVGPESNPMLQPAQAPDPSVMPAELQQAHSLMDLAQKHADVLGTHVQTAATLRAAQQPQQGSA